MKKIFLSILVTTLVNVVLLAKDYKGAELYSNQSYLYGRFEMKIKAAEGSGILSAFFLYRNESETNSKLWEEIDIEIFGKDTNSYQTNIITEKTEGTKKYSEVVHRPKVNLQKDYHTYVLEWTPDYIAWYFNDVEIRRDSAVNNEQVAQCKDAMSIRFNTWAHTSTEWVGAFDTKKLPQTQYVEYLKYSEYTPDSTSTFTLKWTDDFDAYTSSRWSKANWTFDGNYVDFLPSNIQVKNGKLELWLTSSLKVEAPSSVVESETSSTTVFPSPTSGEVTIQSDKNILDISVYNTKGQFKGLFQREQLNLTSFDSGVYFLHVRFENETKIHKIVKK